MVRVYAVGYILMLPEHVGLLPGTFRLVETRKKEKEINQWVILKQTRLYRKDNSNEFW